MHVVQITPKFYPSFGGVQTHVKKISEELVKQGVDVEVLTTDPSGKLPVKETINHVKVVRFKSWAPSESYHFSSELRKYLKAHAREFEIVHAHSYHDLPAYYVSSLKNRSDFNFVFTPHYHGSGHSAFRQLIHLFYRPIGAKIFNNADAIICVSEFEKRLVLRDFPRTSTRVIVIPNGVDSKLFRRVEEMHQQKTEKIILFVGRLEKYKRVDTLIQSLLYLNPAVRMCIIGMGPEKTRLVKLSKDLGVAERVVFEEKVSDLELAERYRLASVLVSLSSHEAYGLSIAESLSIGTPCVVANSTALSEWIDGKRCFGVDNPDDPKNVAYVINNAMDKQFNTLVIKDWAEISKCLVRLYEHVLSLRMDR